MKLRLLVKNIYCSWCVRLIRKDFARKFGINNMDIRSSDPQMQEISFEYDKNTKRENILKALKNRGIFVISVSP